MTTYTFNFNSIEVTISIDADTLKLEYITPEYVGVKTVWEIGDFTRERKQKKIISNFLTYKADATTGTIVPNTIQTKQIINRNTVLTQTGQGQYDFFNDLQTGTDTIGHIADFACINNLLENLIDVFGEPVPCFNPYDSWSFFHPIQVSLNASGNVITATIENPVQDMSYEYSLDGATYQPSNVFSDLSQGTYTVYVRSTTELVAKSKQITI